MTLSINDTQHDNALHNGEYHYAECCVLSIAMLSVIILSVVTPLFCPFGINGEKSFITLTPGFHRQVTGNPEDVCQGLGEGF